MTATHTQSPQIVTPTTVDLQSQGLTNLGQVQFNLAPAPLIEQALHRGEGLLSDRGAFTAWTGERTGRSPKDRFIVATPNVKDEIDWGEVNQSVEPEVFDRLFEKTRAYLQQRDLFVCDAWACAEKAHRLPVRVITEKAWHALFAQALLIRPPHSALDCFVPEMTVIAACGLKADPKVDGVPGETFILLNLERRLVLIGGTMYAGEIKKAIFSFLNYQLPHEGVFPMHCSANIGKDGKTALFFGLSGTGKTTLSADAERQLIGDDEHGWSENGVFNIEGGCYAKCIRLSKKSEPQIWNALRFGSILENVVLDEKTRVPDFDDDTFTENTRAGYPIDSIANAEPTSQGGHPENVLFLTCDAFGVLPPVSRLTPEQAMYHFLSGYTAKVAGTETGITEPKATFSTCFAAPFLPLAPSRYAEMLREKLEKHQSQVWLINTGWTGGAYGTGRRIHLGHTRAMVHAVLDGSLSKESFKPDPVFQVDVPQSCPNVPEKILQPQLAWSDVEAYRNKAKHLATLFNENFQQYTKVSEKVRKSGPKV